jgi:DNA-binding response OmpR family regulator
MAKLPVAAIFNSNDDVVEMLRLALENAGFVVVSGHIDELKRGEQLLTDFVEEHDPDVVIYDLVPPYERSWRFLEHLRESPTLRNRPFVITSTNAARASQIIGTAQHVHEIVGKPYDIDAIVKSTFAAVERHRGSQPGAS